MRNTKRCITLLMLSTSSMWVSMTSTLVHSVARTVLDLFLANLALKLEVTALVRTSKRSYHDGVQIIGQAKSMWRLKYEENSGLFLGPAPFPCVSHLQ